MTLTYMYIYELSAHGFIDVVVAVTVTSFYLNFP